MSRPLKCLDCPQSEVYSSENELEAHIAAEHIKLLPYGCGICKYGKFPTEYALVKHYAEVHETTSNITLNVCYSTNLPLRRKELEEKLKMCIEARDSPEGITPGVTMSSNEVRCGPLKCLDCTEVYNYKEKLVAHIAEEHLQSMPYKCEICKHAMFPTEHVLICHYREDHKRTGAINLTMSYSPEIVVERKELAKRVAMCLASSSRRSIDPVPIDRKPTIPARMDSPSTATPAKQSEATRKSSRISKKKRFADFVVEPPLPPTTPRMESEKDTAGSSTTPEDLSMSGTESNGVSDTSNTSIHPDLDLVRDEYPSTPPPAKKQRPVKREAPEGSSEHSAKRVPVKLLLKTPLNLHATEDAIKTEVPDAITPVTSEAGQAVPLKKENPPFKGHEGKIEEPDDLLEIKKEANAVSPCKVKRPVPYSLKIEESEGILEEQEEKEDQEDQMEQEDEEYNGSEDGSEGSTSSTESVKCALCPKILTSKKNASKKAHACSKHGYLALFECGYCGCQFNGDQKQAVKKHIQQCHKELGKKVDLNNFKDNRKKLKMKIKMLTDKCFPK
ncbi:hypothetical protein CAEBREN_21949 [Caenorhabditis brenneri]|uniref:C2H2-type domain-containing protein n=1 Tax=Caenorhabditis brenneri TaxID=135651 RepID=G0PJ05_CAEBE|nr:hypothetical protein CAEBREN_21949 [Caenorhabditis brenneri]